LAAFAIPARFASLARRGLRRPPACQAPRGDPERRDRIGSRRIAVSWSLGAPAPVAPVSGEAFS